jgi:hypothetical protein
MYFPWVGFMAQMALADVMIWLDDVQFSKGSFTNRVQVKTPTGRNWMSVPLVGKGNRVLIRDLATTDNTTPIRHKALLRNTLGKAAYGKEMLQAFEAAWTPQAPLVDTLIQSAEVMADAIGLPLRRTLRASEMNIAGSGSERVLALVKSVGGDKYITGHGARKYLDHVAFDDGGVGVHYMDYGPVPWPQEHGTFTPYVTALDLIAYIPADARQSHLAPRTLAWQTFMAQN